MEKNYFLIHNSKSGNSLINKFSEKEELIEYLKFEKDIKISSNSIISSDFLTPIQDWEDKFVIISGNLVDISVTTVMNLIEK